MKIKDVLKTDEAYVAIDDRNVPIIRFYAFDDIDWLNHGFSTRLGGVSKGKWESMNPSFSRGDDENDALENIKRIAAALNMPFENMVFSKQTHTTNIRIVSEDDKGKGIIKERDYTDIDGLMTHRSQIPLVTFYADCVPLFLVDPIHKVIASSHSGWRGTVNKMGFVTVSKMQEEYGTNPKDIIAVIGPSICKKCYEISEDVALAFQSAFNSSVWDEILVDQYMAPDGKTVKYKLDLWKANSIVLENAGIPKNQIHISGLCTHCHSDFLWSHRTTGNDRGTLAGYMMINSKEQQL